MGIGLWKTEGMNKPSLVIIKWQGRNPVVGTCSSCPQTRFSTEGKFGKPSEHERELRDLFDQHFRTVHMREDPGQQKPPRITENIGGRRFARRRETLAPAPPFRYTASWPWP